MQNNKNKTEKQVAGADVWSGAPDVFENISDVAQFVAQHFRAANNKPLAARTIRGHLQGRGKKGKLLFPRPDGGYALDAIRNYVGRMGFVAVGVDQHAGDRVAAARAVEIEIAQEEKKLERLELQNRRMEFELAERQREFVRLADLDAELAARALAIRHFLERSFDDNINAVLQLDRDGALQVLMDAVAKALNDYVSVNAFYILRPEMAG